MFAEVHGSGAKTIVAYHGWAGDHRDFTAVGRHLPEGWRLVAVDLPGYGRTPALGTLNAETLAEALAAHLDSLGAERVTLTGFCSGAILALLAAQRRPDRAERLVLIDAFAYLPWYFRVFVLGEFGRRAYQSTFASPLGRRITDWAVRRRGGADAGFMESFREVDHATVHAYLRLLAGLGRLERFRDVRAPVALCWGEGSFGAVQRSVERFRSVWPDADLHPIRHAGHLLLVRGAPQIRQVLIQAEPARQEPSPR